MVTKARQQKFAKHFERYDADSDGKIDQSDIDALINRWCDAFNIAPGSDKWRITIKRANRLWQDLQGHADANGDKVINLEEWISAHEDPRFVDEVAIPLAQLTFELGDTDGDGSISLSEWMTLQSISGVGQVDALKMFQALDHDGDGYISTDEHDAALREFFGSDDLQAAGTQLAGRL
ncbi:EF hand domain-containing protein [Nocardia tenerifensis]|uniref:EF hand domain-containing protein n=1 Tax=Nocardia tenerifensis TaxID=228006 RepID=A0A318K9L7_9NOCA|nr:EF-hand domain-containing protein [Nocardia tenerifensis]PXX70597.1 EF hand domain-containing protein [Nocardia tenerifensis]